MDIHECDSSPCRFNGTCLELSDQSLYSDESMPWRHLLPEHFSYDNAEGFKCACPAGTTGEICEVNINECASSPCQHGK
jgi:protein crumbs